MKNFIIIITILFNIFCISCTKSNSSSTKSLIGKDLDGDISYYTLYKQQYICLFACDGDDISSFTNQNIQTVSKCPHYYLFAANYSNTKKDYPEDIQQKIIDPILEADSLTVLAPADYELFTKFTKTFLKYGECSNEEMEKNKDKKEKDKGPCDHCYTLDPYDINSKVIFKLWEKTKYNSDIMYQAATHEPLGGFQWSSIMKNYTKMTYEEAKKTCEEYTFRNYSDWSLPTKEQLEQAATSLLGEEINDTLNNSNISPEDLVWSLTESKDNKVSVVSLIKVLDDPIISEEVSKDKEFHTICVRKYKHD